MTRRVGDGVRMRLEILDPATEDGFAAWETLLPATKGRFTAWKMLLPAPEERFTAWEMLLPPPEERFQYPTWRIWGVSWFWGQIWVLRFVGIRYFISTLPQNQPNIQSTHKGCPYFGQAIVRSGSQRSIISASVSGSASSNNLDMVTACKPFWAISGRASAIFSTSW